MPDRRGSPVSMVAPSVEPAIGPTATFGVNVNALAFAKLSLSITPVPPRLITFGLPMPFEVTVTEPVRGPVVLGVKVMLIVQLAPAPREAGHVLVCANSALAVMLEMATALAEVFVRVTVWGSSPFGRESVRRNSCVRSRGQTVIQPMGASQPSEPSPTASSDSRGIQVGSQRSKPDLEATRRAPVKAVFVA